MIINEEKGKTGSKGDRRLGENGRRRGIDRRVAGERRLQGETSESLRRSLKAWVRTIINPRLGVDRRSRIDQRSMRSRRQSKQRSILSGRSFVDFFK